MFTAGTNVLGYFTSDRLWFLFEQESKPFLFAYQRIRRFMLSTYECNFKVLVPGTKGSLQGLQGNCPNANDIGICQNKLVCSCNLLRILLSFLELSDQSGLFVVKSLESLINTGFVRSIYFDRWEIKKTVGQSSLTTKSQTGLIVLEYKK